MKSKYSIQSLSWIIAFGSVIAGCSAEETDVLKAGGPSLDSADKISFVSDVSWLSPLSSLDQASLPWIWGNFIFSETVSGQDVPVLFDAAAPPTVKVDVKIEVATTADAATTKIITLFEQADLELSLMTISASISSGDSDSSYDKIPDSVPLVGGKTIYPLYFMASMGSYNWSALGDNAEVTTKGMVDSGDFSGIGGILPLLACETVKISVSYKGTATESGVYQIVSEKFMAADPAVTINLLGQLSGAFGPVIAAQTGIDITAMSEGLKNLNPAACEAPDDADRALFVPTTTP